MILQTQFPKVSGTKGAVQVGVVTVFVIHVQVVGSAISVEAQYNVGQTHAQVAKSGMKFPIHVGAVVHEHEHNKGFKVWFAAQVRLHVGFTGFVSCGIRTGLEKVDGVVGVGVGAGAGAVGK